MSTLMEDLAQAMGILPEYRDETGTRHATGPETQDALLTAMGIDTASEPAMAKALEAAQARRSGKRRPDWLVVDLEGAPPEVGGDWTLTLEDGDTHEGPGALLDLPLGIHRLEVGGEITWLLAAPARLPEPPLTWGMTLPIYGLKTAEQGGIGSYLDLAMTIRNLCETGIGFVGINPVHAGFPDDPLAFSPYSPSSRRRFSTMHIETGTALGGHDALIDYDCVIRNQNAALKKAHGARGEDPDFDAFRAREGEALRRFALHQAISAVHGPYWTHWPEDLRDPETAAARAFAEDNAEAVEMHAWLQYLAEAQLGQVAETCGKMTLGLYLDLAVGTHPEGAETWADPDLFARGVSLGAPPDKFATGGQRWNLAPMRPRHLEETGFRALAEVLRAQLRYAKVLRIDHILGFERAFWVPEDGVPGAYVKMPKTAMLAVARIEAARAGAVIIGEDLGNIPEGLQADLAEAGILGCRVAMFERDWSAETPTFVPAADYAPRALTSFATHDLPTFAGWRMARDIEWRQVTDDLSDAAAAEAKEARRAEVAALERRIDGTGTGALTGFLAATPSRLVAVQAEDALGLVEQANLPGTIHEHPNWRRRLGIAAADLARAPGVLAAAERMKTAGR